MRSIIVLWTLAAILCCSGNVALRALGAIQQDEALFQRALSDGREVVLLRSPEVPISKLKGLVSEVGAAVASYNIRLELRSPDAQPLVLASRIRYVNEIEGLPRAKFPDAYPNQFLVLAALVEPDRIIFATAEDGQVTLWRVKPFPAEDGSVIAPLSQTEWAPHWSAVHRLTPELLNLNLKAQDGLVEVEMNKHSPDGKTSRITFRQVRDEWKFVAVAGNK